MITELRRNGLNIVRMNFSHGSHEYHKSVIDNARKSETIFPGRPLAIALDTKGPEIRTGVTANNADIPVSAGEELIVSTDDKYMNICSEKVLYMDYKNLANVLSVGKLIYVDDGALSLEVSKRFL